MFLYMRYFHVRQITVCQFQLSRLARSAACVVNVSLGYIRNCVWHIRYTDCPGYPGRCSRPLYK